MEFTGKAWKYGKNIDTDLIIAARYLNTSDENELAKHVLEDLDSDFAENVSKGDIIVAEENFGCGSSREHAPLSLKAAGVSVVIAKSFARIFYRNAINIGLPIMESKEAVDDIEPGDILKVTIEKGTIQNMRTNNVFQAIPFPDFMMEIVKAGGLINFVKQKVLKAGDTFV
ncbi:MAG: 3-isopropylmalate dehydratase small subunit [Actinomycetia bacterium]|nr:3-isopropylmalate dehydratase small subunit [Actinomycetes bacterium]